MLINTSLAIEIAKVVDDDGLGHFQQTAFGGFGLPVEMSSFFLSDAFVALPGTALFVGYADGQPCATAALVATGDVAGVYWVATLEEFRGRGLGRR